MKRLPSEPPSRLQVFNNLAQKVAREFPDVMNELIAVTEKEVVFISPVLKEQGLRPRHLSDVVHFFKDYMQQNPTTTAAFTSLKFDNGEKFPVMALNAGYNASRPLVEVMWSIQHEIGHLVVPGGNDFNATITARECIAETYAALRHAQTCAADDTYIEAHSVSRARNIFSGQAQAEFYYHPYALQMVDALKGSTALRTATSAEIVQLTLDIVAANRFDEETVARLSQINRMDFNRRTPGGEEYTDGQLVADFARASGDRHIVSLCNTALSGRFVPPQQKRPVAADKNGGPSRGP